MSEELLLRATLYYCRENEDNFIHSYIWIALSITLMILDSSLFSPSEENLFCHIPVLVSWGNSVKPHVFYGIYLQFVVWDAKFQPKIQKYKLSQCFLNLAIKNNSDLLNMGSMNRYFVTLNMQMYQINQASSFFLGQLYRHWTTELYYS